MADTGIDVTKLVFSAEFGRNLEYYTGFVFEITVPGLGPQSPIAGGGRYDKLMRAVGSTVDVPAMGAMIHRSVGRRFLAALGHLPLPMRAQRAISHNTDQALYWFFSQPMPRPRLEPSLRQGLNELFRPEVEKLEAFAGRKFSGWLS